MPWRFTGQSQNVISSTHVISIDYPRGLSREQTYANEAETAAWLSDCVQDDALVLI